LRIAYCVKKYGIRNTQYVRHTGALLILLLLWLLVACGGGAAQPIVVSPTALPSTPTLAAAVAALALPQPPTPEVLPPGAGTAVIPPATPEAETAVIIPTVTPFPSPTPTPLPAERLDLAVTGLAEGNYEQAVDQLTAALAQSDALSPAARIESLYALGTAYGRDGRYAEAVQTFNQLLTEAPEEAPWSAYYLLGQAYAALGDDAAALTAYETYLQRNGDMAAYVQPRIAELHNNLGNDDQAIAAYEAALSAPANRFTEIATRRYLAQVYLDAGNYAAAVAQYDAIRAVAQTEFTRGEMAYLAGYADLLAGNNEAAYGRFQEALTAYPNAYETYLGLVALVEAGQPVDDYQRGLVNFNAKSYAPALAAFTRYLEQTAEPNPDAYLYQAWSQEALGDLPGALATLEQYAAVLPAEALMERGKLLARAGDVDGALQDYLAYLETYPQGPEAPFAAWWSAVIAQNRGEVDTAVARYLALADAYPAHEDAPEALFRAGLLANNSGDVATAVTHWLRVGRDYPNSEWGSAALVWLLRALPTYTGEDAAELLAQAQTLAETRPYTGYYALRARDIAQGNTPYVTETPFVLPDAAQTAVAQEAAETWLRGWLGLSPDADVRTLSPELAANPRLQIGEKLWELGEWEAAKLELEGVRQAHADDALASYQLALFFRDLGLYRSSILAAARLPVLSQQSEFDLPLFIGRLLYPVYYADLVLPLAQQYGYDPRLQFALLRQESLFESFARSSAAAQGLSQVIPDTGAYIAERLNWPNFVNEDLYKPYVGLNFGAYYLNQQLDAFDGMPAAALAAYNAGPGNAARWFAQAGADHDQFYEAVDFAETRTYITRIYEGYDLYRHLYGGE
jgi:soluble lytic murein transglycosylase